jgi:hypothetical protein
MGGFVIAESQGALDDDALAAMMEAVEARTAAAASGGASDGATGGSDDLVAPEPATTQQATQALATQDIAGEYAYEHPEEGAGSLRVDERDDGRPARAFADGWHHTDSTKSAQPVLAEGEDDADDDTVTLRACPLPPCRSRGRRTTRIRRRRRRRSERRRRARRRVRRRRKRTRNRRSRVIRCFSGTTRSSSPKGP